ncbi:MAG: LiaI-LiaF-like domain-containing protein [Thermoleophilia bacterium]
MDERTTPDQEPTAGEGYAPPEALSGGTTPPVEAAPQPAPVPPAPHTQSPPPVVEPPRERDRGRRTLGIVLIALGVVFLVNQFIAWDIFWPVILIVIGLIVLFRR